ncbi:MULTISPECIES: coniferyl aldehyde dehydrogenase [unclassified Vibrio]|uniref:Aldehyde dehydrogenase n=1 Tax=Vibrio sp. HB236076 TaxID=3232307 RepID=A0AB39HH91_9VIBR|nr:coniferyl aldehyde dehydrogenase [Vibrio sp. HB161653]MDP5253079.1 coniferyl aldehyde dehydrogenase [Vibrio sp. HB161653]
MSSTDNQSQLRSILKSMKKQQINNGPASIALRQDRLARSMALIADNHQALTEAISQDFGHRSAYQTGAADLLGTINLLQHASDNLADWMQPERVEAPAPGMQTAVQYQPLGVVGVISPWNFPINLAFGPLASVFAAGNTAMLKPSELTPKTSQLLAELVGRYFGPEELTVVLGDAEVGQAFSALPFDHLIFTGSTAVGKHVMRAAAEHLVPVTLELGGKSPVVVAKDADLTKAVERTLTVKAFNAGQICISPDYLILAESQREAFVDQARQFMAGSFPTIYDNPDYTAIINERHFNRLVGLLDDAKAKGATLVKLAADDEPAYDAQRRKVAPHLVLDVNDDMAIMQEEIFGPLLPVKTYQDEQEAITYVNAHPRPLAAYFFSESEQNQQHFANHTTSGALVVNDVMTHVSIENLPFGGVGPSGMGAYHGIYGFRQFSHAKPVVIQSEQAESSQRLRAPYQEKLTALNAFFQS